MEGSNYYQIPGLDLWDINRDAYNFTGNNLVIAHPPCQQWSKLKSFAKDNQREKDLAFFCLEQVNKNGGILEHPAGSSFFKAANINMRKVISVNQSWWGFPAPKRTYLYYNGVRPISSPLSLDRPIQSVEKMSRKNRSKMPLAFCQWLVNNVNSTNLP